MVICSSSEVDTAIRAHYITSRLVATWASSVDVPTWIYAYTGLRSYIGDVNDNSQPFFVPYMFYNFVSAQDLIRKQNIIVYLVIIYLSESSTHIYL